MGHKAPAWFLHVGLPCHFSLMYRPLFVDQVVECVSVEVGEISRGSDTFFMISLRTLGGVLRLARNASAVPNEDRATRLPMVGLRDMAVPKSI